jgi:proton glutamate symport protein
VTLSAQVLVGLLLGIASGVFFGELIAPVGFVGRAFILLLQMTVLPYVSVSLIKALGSLSARQAVDLVRKAGGFLLLLWGVALLTVLLIPLTFPHWTSASFFSNTLVQPPPPFDFLGLFIPANPFASLAQNTVPAVVVFSIALGVALIGLPGAEPLVRALSVLTDALGRIAGFVVRLAPIGVFAIAAEAAGSMDLGQIGGLQVYVVTYLAMALFLSLWVLPGLVTALTPFRYREVVGMTRDALVTAFATGNVFVVLSVLSEKSKELVAMHCQASGEPESFVEVVVPTAFTLPSAGKLLALSFVVFAGWLSGFPIAAGQYPAFAVSGLFSFFGNTFVAIPFLLDLFRIPADTFQLFVVADNVVGRFGSLVAAMHILALSLLAASAVAGALVFRWARLLRFLLVTALAGVGLMLGIRFGFESLGHQYQGYELFVNRGLLRPGVAAQVLAGPPAELPAVDPTVPTLDRIRRRGTLRVGYRSDALPNAFQNGAGQLVGLDVELMHRLAGYLDLATGVAVTPARMTELSFSPPYREETLAFIVPDYRRAEFSRADAVRAMPTLRLAVPPIRYYQEKIRGYLPQAELVPIASPRAYFRHELQGIDALVFTAEAGSAWCLIYPEFSVAVPQPDVLRAPIAFPVARGDTEMARFLGGWIELKREDGTLDALFDYWVRGRAVSEREPHWSVIRDVLHWVE